MNRKPQILLIYSLLFFVFINTSLISCSQDEELIDLVGIEDPKEEPKEPNEEGNGEGEETDPETDGDSEETDNDSDFDSTDGLKISTTPCDFLLSDATSNSTIEIDCRMDLKGQTVNLPAGVTLTYTGGEIINGTLNFSSQGIIDGNLLNKDLEIEGDVQLSSQEFNFYPERWGIVQGESDVQEAKDNSLNIQDAINIVHQLNGAVFEIDKLDAFFYGKGDYNYNIVMPSNFHLKMTDNTHLRTFPSLDKYSTFLIIIQGVENVRVTGGNLHGDRDLYGRKDNLPLSHTMKIKTGVNVVIENVHMSNATEDGLAIESIRFAYDPAYVGSNNIQVRNCVFDSNRRINLTITDGNNILIEGNTFIDGGVDTPHSNSAAPSCNLNIEPLRGGSPGNVIEYQRVHDVIIRNNKQYVRNKENTKAGGFLLSHGYGPIIVENNEMTNNGISFHTVDGVIIRNNNITGGGIGAGSAESYERVNVVFGNEIYGNKVINEGGTALNIAGNGVLVRDNELEGVIGVALGAGSTDQSKGVSNSILSNNVIRARSRGITSQNTIKNVLIENNKIEMLSGANFSFSLVNKWTGSSSASFVVKGNTVVGVKSNSTTGAPPSLIGANSIDFIENQVGDVQINGGSNIKLSGNTIDANIGANGVLFYDDAPSSVISNNRIRVYSSATPLNVQCVKVNNGVSISNSVSILDNECLEE